MAVVPFIWELSVHPGQYRPCTARSQVMMVFLACRRDLSSRAVVEAAWGSEDAHVQSTATRRPRPQAFGARGVPYLTFDFASKPRTSAPWARGLLSAFWEWGSPDLPACGPRRGSGAGPYGPSSSARHSRPSRGAKPREEENARPPQGRPHQAASRGAEISRQGKPREALVT